MSVCTDIPPTIYLYLYTTGSFTLPPLDQDPSLAHPEHVTADAAAGLLLFRRILAMSMSAPISYRNPILPGFNPDPSIIRVGPDFFLITSTFEYFPGIPLYHSTDLINWTLLGHVLSRPSQLDLRACEPGMGVFAPTIRHHKGRFYVTVCAFHRKSRANGMDVSAAQTLDWFGPALRWLQPMIGPRGFYVSTTDIWDTKSWSDPTYYDVLGIDQDVRDSLFLHSLPTAPFLIAPSPRHPSGLAWLTCQSRGPRPHATLTRFSSSSTPTTGSTSPSRPG